MTGVMGKKKPAASKKPQLPAVKVSHRVHYLMGIVAALKNKHLKDACTDVLEEFAVSFLADRSYKPDAEALAAAERLDAEMLED